MKKRTTNSGELAADSSRALERPATLEANMKEQFKELKFRAETLKMIESANEIIAAYQRQGYTLTLRQLYYQ